MVPSTRLFAAALSTLYLTAACAGSHPPMAESQPHTTAQNTPVAPTTPGVTESIASPADDALFNNPVAPVLSADPSIVMVNGVFNYVKSTGGGIDLYQSATLAGLSTVQPVHIVQMPESGGPGDNCDLWAPELRLIDGAWWVYYAATSSAGSNNLCDGTDRNASHRMFAASADSANVAGSWTRQGKLAPTDSDHWAIDGTTLQMPSGALYFVWSGIADGQPDGGFPQQLFIAPMSNPGTLSGPRVMISSPTQPWEQADSSSTFGWINEGPEAIVHNGVPSIVFSANGSWDNRYALGITTLAGANPLDPGAWNKNTAGPIFSQNVSGWGTGHHTFFTSPDGTEQWIAFHSFNVSNGGWDSREVRAQRILGWNADNTPNLGSPVSPGAFVEPATNGLHASFGLLRKFYNAQSGLCLNVAGNSAVAGAGLQLSTCNGMLAQRFALQNLANDTVRIETQAPSQCLDISGAATVNGAALSQGTCGNAVSQVFSLQVAPSGAVALTVPFSGKCLDVPSTAVGTAVRQWDCNGSAAQQWWVLESSFDDGRAYQILNMSSGKCVDVTNGSSDDGTRIRQWTCNGAAAQKYSFTFAGADSNGKPFYNLVNRNRGKCVAVDSASLTPGAQLLQSTCSADLSQQWSVTSVGTGSYTLTVRHSGQSLDLQNGDPADDARLQQWPANGLLPQTWTIRL